MKKIIGWFKNILMRILEVVNYMVKKDNEIELAKLEVKREIAKDVFEAVSDTLSNKKVLLAVGCASFGVLYMTSKESLDKSVQIGLGCAAVGWGVSLLYNSLRNSNITNSN